MGLNCRRLKIKAAHFNLNRAMDNAPHPDGMQRVRDRESLPYGVAPLQKSRPQLARVWSARRSGVPFGSREIGQMAHERKNTPNRSLNFSSESIFESHLTLTTSAG